MNDILIAMFVYTFAIKIKENGLKLNPHKGYTMLRNVNIFYEFII